VAIGRRHGHIWTFPEVDGFVDSVLRGGAPLAWPEPPRIEEGRLVATLHHRVELTNASLCFTTNSGPWQKRTWQTAPARVEGRRITAELPSARPLVAFLGMTDASGRYVSTEHVEMSR